MEHRAQQGSLKETAKGVGAKPSAVAACVAKASNTFTTAFAKAETKPPCSTAGDTAAVESDVDGFLAGLQSGVTAGGATGTCPARNLAAPRGRQGRVLRQ